MARTKAARKRQTKKSKKGSKTTKAHRRQVRRPHTVVAVLPETSLAVLSDAVHRAMQPFSAQVGELSSAVRKLAEPPPPVLASKEEPKPALNGQHLMIGVDQRYTKNLGNFETFVYGFSLSIPIPVVPGDDPDNPATRDRLRPKYEAMANFINGMMKEVGQEIDAHRGAPKP